MWMFWLFLSLVSVLVFSFTIYFLESWVKPHRHALKRGDRARLKALEQEIASLRDEITSLREEFADLLLALDEREAAFLPSGEEKSDAAEKAETAS